MPHPNVVGASLLFDALTRDRLRELAPFSTLVLPLGSTEQHGHHLPTRTDAAIVEALARRAAQAASERVPVLVAPTLPFGCSHHHLPFGGTLSLTTATYVDLICDLVAGLAEEGFRSIVLLNGHGGNDAAIRVAVDRLTNEVRCGAHIAATSYWLVATDDAASSRWETGHAGHFETSVMLALSPDLVDLARRPQDSEQYTPLGRPDVTGAKIGRPKLWEVSDGRTDDAQEASAESGARIVDEIAAALADFLVAFHNSTPAAQG
jgi:creatinine amidohydrolase